MSTTTRRQFVSLLGVAAAGAAVAACGKAGDSNAAAVGGAKTTTLRYQGSVGQVTPPELAQDLGYLGNVKLKWVGNTISGPQDIQSAATGQTDYGGAFNGAVAKLAAAGAPITAVIGYYGVDKDAYSGFYVLNDSPIKGARDLIGTKVGMNTLGAHSEAILDIYLSRNGLTPADIKKVEPLVVPPITTEQSIRQKQIEVGVLGGIFRDKALATGGIRKVFSDFELLGGFTAGTYVFRDDFIKKNPDTVRTFVSGVGKAIEWARTTPHDQVLARLTKIVQGRGRNETADALKYWKSYGVAGKGGVIVAKEFDTWITWLEQQGQIPKGKVKASDVYTNKYNSFAAGGQ
ncbi:MAG: twin-arginine translocation pathway signal [Actinomycetia bacterium]|nr:twin-arginine translocation pathway signal [Actinomycetes bacterium]